MYLLYLDESGTHGGSPVFVLGGVAVHEQDAWHLQNRLDGVLSRLLPPAFMPREFELHAAEIKSPHKATLKKPASPWLSVNYQVRTDVLKGAYREIGRYRPRNPAHPIALFGAVVDTRYPDHEVRAYEEVLHKFDVDMGKGFQSMGEDSCKK